MLACILVHLCVTIMMHQRGSVAVEYLLLLIFFAVLAISNMDDIENQVGNTEGEITTALGLVATAINGAASGL